LQSCIITINTYSTINCKVFTNNHGKHDAWPLLLLRHTALLIMYVCDILRPVCQTKLSASYIQ
jgi:hypothetical protein